MADKNAPLPPRFPSSGNTDEHEFSADLERFDADYSVNFSSNDIESQRQVSSVSTAAVLTARSKEESPETSFEMIAMGSPVMSKWRWIGEKELQYLVTNKRASPSGYGAGSIELAGRRGPQQQKPQVATEGMSEALDNGALVRVVHQGSSASTVWEKSFEAGRGEGGGSSRPTKIAHILLPTAALVSSRSPGRLKGNAVRSEDAVIREPTEFVTATGGKKRKVSSIDNDTGQDQDLEKGMLTKAALGTPSAPPAPAVPASDRVDDDGEEPVCRVCHMSTAEPMKSDVIDLGCACKLDLGHAHRECAETWFQVRGNRQCEICGEIAQNVRLLEPSNGSAAGNLDTSVTVVTVHPSPSACWQNRPIRNFLLVFLVTAFLVPWLFRFAYYQFSPK